ncbi:MAG: glucosamine-6-phosphate deaminase [Chloroflexia bacterium]|jgi:glucosamine-6-phosphate deaminase|nr:glucosamine-6-phosphate deaminase [Chloroflexia bacterium]
MRLIVTEDYDSLSRVGANFVAEIIAANPAATVVPAMGDTPMRIYAELAARRQRRELDTLQIRVFQLDEYAGIDTEDPRLLYGWLLRSFVAPLGIPESNVVRLRGDVEDVQAACRDYESAAHEAGGFDLAILGLGPNGHLGFNEPPSEPDAPTRVVELTDESLESNARYWGGKDRVPRTAVTAGMDLLLASKQILLVVSGEHKSEILRRTINGPATPEVPASLLQHAANVTVIADRASWPFSTAGTQDSDSWAGK